MEFMTVVTRGIGQPKAAAARIALLSQDAQRETEAFLSTFRVLYPDAAMFRTALRGAAAYKLSWFDAHIWAYAEHYGLDELISEDFEHGRIYGSVRIRNPFC
jgi:predicted nucleic acid-binding protein